LDCAGGDSGIGRAAAIACAREGADVAVVYLSHDEDANDTRQYIEKAGVRCLLLKCDVSDRRQCIDAVESTVRTLGKIDSLINNAGVQYAEEDLDEASENLEKIFATNVFSCFWLGAAALKHMKDNSGCTIIQNTSINAFVGNDSLMSYACTKGAMQTFTRSLAKKLASRGIRVNAVAPGPIWTAFIPAVKDSESFGEQNPMGRAGQPVECAPAFVYLASADSSFVTGNTIHVDGGQYTSS
jgi:NAD(P)-dependent dehydrogenase (short-subunit alcohol dehydrogenase family)